MSDYARLVVVVDSTQVKTAEKAIKDLGGTSKRTESSAGSLGRTLTRLAAPLAAFLSVRAVINASDQYGQMASRMRQATSSAEEYVSVQARLIDTANRTYRPLAEAQELYIRTADSLKSLGYETNAALDITDSFSFLLVANAASADRAGSAINAYSKAIQTGKVDSESWQSILAAMPTVVDSLSAATGRSTQEIRELGISGKLSLNALNEALRQSVDVNGELADKMETSVADAIVTLQNSFQVLIGKANETSGATSGLVTAIEDMAAILQDPKTIQGLADLATGLVTLTSWLVQAAAATGTFFDELTDGLAGIKNMSQMEAMEQAIRDIQSEINNLQGDLNSPDWALKIRGLDRGEIEARMRSLRLDMQGMKDMLATVNKEESLASVEKDLDSVLSKLGGFSSAARSVATVPAEISKTADAAKKLATEYKSAVQGLERQLALYGQNSESARTHYELINGSLKGVVGKQAEYLMGLAQELDAKRDLTEQEQLRIDILRESGQLRAANDAQFDLEYAEKIAEYERQGNKEAIQRLETLRRIREVQMNADQAPGTVEGVSKAPGTRGIDAVVAGPSGELMKLEQDAIALEQWRATELEKQRALLEAKATNEQVYAERVENIHQQHQDRIAQIEAARQQVQLAAGEAFFGNMAGLTKAFAGEQSGAYKAMFALEKGYALAKVLMNAPKTASDAYAAMAGIPYVGPALGIAAAAAALSYQAAQASGISSINLSGMAHDGIDSIPKEGTWLLDKGERVVDRRTNSDLKEFLSDGEGKGAGMTVNVSLIEDPSKAGTVEKTQNNDGSWSVNAFIADLYGDGPAAKAISQNFGIQKVGR